MTEIDRLASLRRLGQTIRIYLRAPVDIASLATFRFIFGATMLIGIIRFWHRGWIESLYIEPSYHFTYWGFGWIQAWPAWGMYLHFGLLAVASAFVALGFYYRVSITLFFFGFTYIELIDKTNYLNHYYLISILSLLMVFLPLHRAWSVDAWRQPSVRVCSVPCWCLLTIRCQVGLVYFFAGVAKLQSDWLWDAEPLATWLATHTEIPIIGPLLAKHWFAYVASWSGAIFDLTIVAWLCWPRSRRAAFIVLVAFHLATAHLFYLGMFPWIMIGNALIFFSSSWPRRWIRLKTQVASTIPQKRSSTWYHKVGLILLGSHFILQLFMPMRHHLYPGNVCWNEEGFRYAWHVMLVEKTGHVLYHVTDPDTQRRWIIYPNEYLTANQEKQMSTQPDMILALAHHIAEDFATRGYRKVEVRAEAYVALNGRPSRPFIDPTVNLAAEQDRLSPKVWIRNLPNDD